MPVRLGRLKTVQALGASLHEAETLSSFETKGPDACANLGVSTCKARSFYQAIET